MENPSKRNQWPLAIGCVVAITAVVSLFVFAFISIMFAGFGSKVPWSLAEHLPEGVVVLEEIADQSGMDSFFLVKAEYSSEDDITEICDEYLLLLEQSVDLSSSFAAMYAQREDVPWFPLSKTTRRYAFDSVNWDGTVKENASGRYDAVLWINDEEKIFILQLAAL